MIIQRTDILIVGNIRTSPLREKYFTVVRIENPPYFDSHLLAGYPKEILFAGAFLSVGSKYGRLKYTTTLKINTEMETPQGYATNT